MEKDIIRDYAQLYILQDKVLKIIFAEETPFYLTGGTALHRFYCNERCSDIKEKSKNSLIKENRI